MISVESEVRNCRADKKMMNVKCKMINNVALAQYFMSAGYLTIPAGHFTPRSCLHIIRYAQPNECVYRVSVCHAGYVVGCYHIYSVLVYELRELRRHKVTILFIVVE